MSLNPDVDLMLGGSELDEDNLVLDLDNVSEEMPELEALPSGIYNVVIENTEYRVSERSSNPMISWTFRVLDEPYDGRLLFYHTVLNKESGLVRLKQLMVRVLPDIPLSGFKPKAFCDEGVALGRPCRVKVNVRPYQGKRRNNVTDVLAPADEMGSFLDEELA